MKEAAQTRLRTETTTINEYNRRDACSICDLSSILRNGLSGGAASSFILNDMKLGTHSADALHAPGYMRREECSSVSRKECPLVFSQCCCKIHDDTSKERLSLQSNEEIGLRIWRH
jgi:hypothetical protein